MPTTSSTDTPLMSSISDDKSETSSSKDEPVVWYAFYSETAGREYYYEPKSKTATWIMPDDYNPHPKKINGECAEDASMPPPKLRRKVSFRADDKYSLNTGRSRSHGGESRSRSKTARVSKDAEKPESVLPVVPCKAVALAITAVSAYMYVHWSVSFQTLQKPYSMHVDQVDLAEETTKKDTIIKDFLPVGADAGIDKREQNRKQKSLDPATHGSNEEVKKKAESPPRGKVTTRSSFKSEPPIMEVAKRIEEEIVLKEENETRGKKGSPPSKCMAPFSYVFSRECREVVKEMPLFDAEMATFSWLQ